MTVPSPLDRFRGCRLELASGDAVGTTVLAAANLGDDADTAAAITGQIARAHYGVGGIPAAWLERLTRVDEIDDIARRIFLRSESRMAEKRVL